MVIDEAGRRDARRCFTIENVAEENRRFEQLLQPPPTRSASLRVGREIGSDVARGAEHTYQLFITLRDNVGQQGA